jgi:hypothetical protein
MASVFDTVGQVWREPPRCRVFGLASEAGRALNGLCGRIISPGGADGEASSRVLVSLEGLHEKKNIKLGNLQLFPDQRVNFGVGVGREELNGHDGTDPTRPAALWFNVVDAQSGQRLAVEDLPEAANSKCGRTMGNVMAVNHMLGTLVAQFSNDLAQAPPACFLLTDLNVSRYVNCVATTKTEPPSVAHDLLAEPMAELVRVVRILTDAGVWVGAAFGPHRCTPDQHEDIGSERVNSIVEHTITLYPSPHPQKVGCVEVRFVGSAADSTVGGPRTSRQERFIDYGPDEAILYMRFAASLGDASRLAPLTLARVDPQAFWAAYLRIDTVAAALSEISAPADVMAAWQPLMEAARESMKTCQRVCPNFTAWDADGTWSSSLTSAETHLQIAQEGALCGWFVSVASAVTNATRGNPLRFHILDDYRGTELGKLFEALMRRGTADVDINAALEKLGFGEDALGLAHNPLKSCGGCGTIGDSMRKCTRCGDQVYCSAECQRKHWPQHKKCCSKAMASLRRTMRHLESRGGEMEMRQCPGGQTSAEIPACIMTEVSGLGSISIMWKLAKGKSMVSFRDMNEMMGEVDSAAGSAEMKASFAATTTPSSKTPIMFASVSELQLPFRFLVSCGPLQDLALAKAALEELLSVIAQGGGTTGFDDNYGWPLHFGSAHPDPRRVVASIRAPAAGFTALEWAAKKGNLGVVEWLCTDERTKCLVREGSPIGWACYTGRIECARLLFRHGADPAATDMVLWGGLPPLCVAAQNGQLEAIRWLVDEVGQDVRLTDRNGRGVVQHAKMAPNWEDCPGQVACVQWANERFKAELSPRYAPAKEEQAIKVGARVTLKGLKSKPELNGASAVVLTKDDATGRFVVRVIALPSGSAPEVDTNVKVKPESLALIVA